MGLIREQILLLTHEEVPHSVAIAIDKVGKHQRLLVYSLPYTLSASKGILIGKGGSMLKAIGSAAREQIQKLIAGKVYLSYLKVQPKWRQSRRLAELGYRVENEAQGLLRKFCKPSLGYTSTRLPRLKRAFSGWSLRLTLPMPQGGLVLEFK